MPNKNVREKAPSQGKNNPHFPPNAPALKNVGKTIVKFNDPSEKNKPYVCLDCGATSFGETIEESIIATDDGKYCQLDFESGEKVPADIIQAHLIIQLSPKDLQQWQEYKKFTGYTDQTMFEELLSFQHSIELTMKV